VSRTRQGQRGYLSRMSVCLLVAFDDEANIELHKEIGHEMEYLSWPLYIYACYLHKCSLDIHMPTYLKTSYF
jgi:hypothetical protein